jgi:hypothetical protein
MEEKFIKINTMKRPFITTLLLALILQYSRAQVCLPAGISTNPAAPVNPTYLPDPAFENHFEWYSNSNNTLHIYELNEMNNYGNVQTMQHPYSQQNQSYQHLNLGIDIEDLDMYPDDGWELLFINLGYYPNGTTAASHFGQIPYVFFTTNRGE